MCTMKMTLKLLEHISINLFPKSPDIKRSSAAVRKSEIYRFLRICTRIKVTVENKVRSEEILITALENSESGSNEPASFRNTEL